jgi:hypothetical protein
MPRTCLVALVAAIAALAVLPAGAGSHGSPHPVINGPAGNKLGNVKLESGRFELPRVTMECPPPESAKPCQVTILVRTERRLRYRAGEPKRKHTVGKQTYKISANREDVEPLATKLNTRGRKLLARIGNLKVVARINLFHHEATIRDFKLTLRPPQQ